MKYKTLMRSFFMVLSVTLLSKMPQRLYSQASLHGMIDSGDHYITKSTEKAAMFYDQVMDEVKRTNNDTLKGRLLVSMAILARMKGNYSRAINLNSQAAKIHIQLQDSISLANDLYNIGLVYRYLKDPISAKRYLHQSEEIRKIKKDYKKLADTYCQLGIIARMENKLDTATLYQLNALEIYKIFDDKKNILTVSGNLAAIEYSRKNYQKCIDINLEALPAIKKTGDQLSLATRYYNIARSFERMDQKKEAVNYYNLAIIIGEKESFEQQLIKYYKRRSVIYRKTGSYKKSLYDNRSLFKYYSKLYNEKQTNKLTEAKLKADFLLKETVDSLRYVQHTNILKLETRSAKQKRNLYLLLFIGTLLISVFLYIIGRNRKKVGKIKSQNQQLEKLLIDHKLEKTEKETHFILEENVQISNQRRSIINKLEQIVNNKNQSNIKSEIELLIFDESIILTEETDPKLARENLTYYNQSFEQRIFDTYPQLSQSQIEICQLIRLGKSTKEIMLIRNMSEGSVKTARYRIRIKLGVDKSRNLVHLLNKL